MKVLVTGGGGFLGQAIVRQLLARGDTVRILQRSNVPELVAAGIDCHCGDIADQSVVARAVSGCDVVFHVAAKAGVWGRYDEYYRANVTGTKNVIAACLTNQVGKLVYTSSPSVVFDGCDEAGVDESTPYPKRYLSNYPKTKAIAEQLVLSANNDNFSTASLRPHLIWGPGDNHLFPRLVQRSRQGKLRRVGDGRNLVDTTYVDNAADAHLAAERALSPRSAVAGKAYFISNGEPLPIWDMINQMLACANEPPVTRGVSSSMAYAVGALMEATYGLLGRKEEPPMTRFVARQLSTAHWFRLDAAKRDFGYEPKVTIAEGLQRLAADWNKTAR